MDRARAQALDRFDVRTGAVTLVSLEPVPRELFGQLFHDAIPCYLRDDARGGNRVGTPVSLYNTLLGQFRSTYDESIDKKEIGRRAEGVGGFGHRPVVGGLNSDFVDGLRLDDSGPDFVRTVLQLGEKALALAFGQPFRVVQPFQWAMQDNGGGYDGPSQRPTARFVYPRDPAVSPGEGFPLEGRLFSYLFGKGTAFEPCVGRAGHGFSEARA